jgi:hypothetical protein
MKLLEADRALVKIPALTMEGRTERRSVSRDPGRTVSQIHALDSSALHGNDVGDFGQQFRLVEEGGGRWTERSFR